MIDQFNSQQTEDIVKAFRMLNARIDELEAKLPKFRNLGYQNSWGAEWPIELKHCDEKGHRRKIESLNESRTHKRIYCDEGCKFEYFVDSGD